MFARLKSTLYGALRWSEAYTKTDMVYAASGGFWLTLARAVGLAVSLLFAVAMANLITPQVFGFYKFVLSGAAIIGAFSLTGMGTAITQAVARGLEGALTQGTKEYFKWSFITYGISATTAIYYFANGNSLLGISFLIAGACTPLITGFSFFGQFISGKKDFRTFSFFDTVRTVAPALAVVLTVLVTSDPVHLVAVFFVSASVSNLFLYYMTIRKYHPNTIIDPGTPVYGRHLSLMGLMTKVAEQLDKVLIFHYLGPAQLAVYAFAQTPINNIRLLNDIPARLALPKLSQRELPELQRSLPRKVFFLMLLATVLAFLYIAIAPFVFRILFPQYIDSVLFTQILALSLIFVPATMFNEALTAHAKKRELYISQTAIPLTRIALLLIFLPLYGVWGAVAVVIATQLLMALFATYLFWNSTR